MLPERSPSRARQAPAISLVKPIFLQAYWNSCQLHELLLSAPPAGAGGAAAAVGKPTAGCVTTVPPNEERPASNDVAPKEERTPVSVMFKDERPSVIFSEERPSGTAMLAAAMAGKLPCGFGEAIKASTAGAGGSLLPCNIDPLNISFRGCEISAAAEDKDERCSWPPTEDGRSTTPAPDADALLADAGRLFTALSHAFLMSGWQCFAASENWAERPPSAVAAFASRWPSTTGGALDHPRVSTSACNATSSRYL